MSGCCGVRMAYDRLSMLLRLGLSLFGLVGVITVTKVSFTAYRCIPSPLARGLLGG